MSALAHSQAALLVQTQDLRTNGRATQRCFLHSKPFAVLFVPTGHVCRMTSAIVTLCVSFVCWMDCYAPVLTLLPSSSHDGLDFAIYDPKAAVFGARSQLRGIPSNYALSCQIQ